MCTSSAANSLMITVEPLEAIIASTSSTSSRRLNIFLRKGVLRRPLSESSYTSVGVMRFMMIFFSEGVNPQLLIFWSITFSNSPITYSIRSSDSSRNTPSMPAVAAILMMVRPSLPAPTTPIFENNGLFLLSLEMVRPYFSMGSMIISLISLYCLFCFNPIAWFAVMATML